MENSNILKPHIRWTLYFCVKFIQRGRAGAGAGVWARACGMMHRRRALDISRAFNAFWGPRCTLLKIFSSHNTFKFITKWDGHRELEPKLGYRPICKMPKYYQGY